MQLKPLYLVSQVSLALLFFAANSLFCRLALASDAIDPASFTAIRLISGAFTLMLLMTCSGKPLRVTHGGNWLSGFMLFAYAGCFSVAYMSLDTGVGALVLFGLVQVTLIFCSFLTGQRLSVMEWLGVIVACSGLTYLLFPGSQAPDLLGLGLMAIAGIAWGWYTLLGKGSKQPLLDTYGNFARALCFLPLLLLVGFENITWSGGLLAVASGALASAIGYSIWYLVLPQLKLVQAGLLQLLVPAIATLAGYLLLDESLTTRFLLASLAILGGITLTLLGKNTVNRSTEA